MRVLLVTANYRPSVGGIERFVEILAHGLAERGHEITVATTRTQGAPGVERDRSVSIVRMSASEIALDRLGVPYPIPNPRSSIRTLGKLLGKVDVVHAQDALYLTTVFALVLASRMGVASVLTQHVGFVPQRRTLLNWAQRAAIATVGRVARRADVVTAYNPRVGVWAEMTWGLDGVQLLPVGVTATRPHKEDRAALREELGIAPNAFVALFAGRDVPKKRLDVVLGARDPAYEIVAVTDRVGGAPAGVHLVPFGSAERFAKLLGAADAFVLPSEAEGFPLALQEALLLGLPCVVAREPGYERYLQEDDVVFVEPNSASLREELRRLSSDQALRERLSARGRVVGEREFGVAPFVDAYERLYSQIVARRLNSLVSL